MLLNKLNENFKQNFLDLAIICAKSSGKIEDEELEILQDYCDEMGIDMPKKMIKYDYIVDMFEENINEYNEKIGNIIQYLLNDYDKAIMYFELTALVYADGVMTDLEKDILKRLSSYLKSDDVEIMRDIALAITSNLKTLKAIHNLHCQKEHSVDITLSLRKFDNYRKEDLLKLVAIILCNTSINSNVESTSNTNLNIKQIDKVLQDLILESGLDISLDELKGEAEDICSYYISEDLQGFKGEIEELVDNIDIAFYFKVVSYLKVNLNKRNHLIKEIMQQKLGMSDELIMLFDNTSLNMGVYSALINYVINKY